LNDPCRSSKCHRSICCLISLLSSLDVFDALICFSDRISATPTTFQVGFAANFRQNFDANQVCSRYHIYFHILQHAFHIECLFFISSLSSGWNTSCAFGWNSSSVNIAVSIKSTNLFSVDLLWIECMSAVLTGSPFLRPTTSLPSSRVLFRQSSLPTTCLHPSFLPQPRHHHRLHHRPPDRQYHYSEIQVPPPPAHDAEACRGCSPCCTCCSAAARLQNVKQPGRAGEGGEKDKSVKQYTLLCLNLCHTSGSSKLAAFGRASRAGAAGNESLGHAANRYVLVCRSTYIAQTIIYRVCTCIYFS